MRFCSLEMMAFLTFIIACISFLHFLRSVGHAIKEKRSPPFPRRKIHIRVAETRSHAVYDARLSWSMKRVPYGIDGDTLFLASFLNYMF